MMINNTAGMSLLLNQLLPPPTHTVFHDLKLVAVAEEINASHSTHCIAGRECVQNVIEYLHLHAHHYQLDTTSGHRMTGLFILC